MSRKGKMPIALPKGVEVNINGQTVSVKGPKGNLQQELRKGIIAQAEGEQLLILIDNADPQEMSKFHGLYRSLLANMVTGVTKGFQVRLELVGVGYRANVKGANVELQVGYSHPVALMIPEGISVAVEEKNTVLILSGANRQALGQFAANIRAVRPPEPYKGKGIRYSGEYIRRKAGKSGK